MKNSVVHLTALLAMSMLVGCTDLAVPLGDQEEYDLGGLSPDQAAALGGGSGGNTSDDGGGGGGTGGAATLISVGRATATGATTYYIDAENGDDANNGTDWKTPWKTFKNVNAKTFNPGDHILLEANSVWNGDPVTATNNDTLRNSDKVGMLWPKGNGANRNHCVIDLYEVHNFSEANQSVSYRSAKRPIINGNGTPGLGSVVHNSSGAINLWNQHHWKIRNIEVTNTFKNPITEPNHWYDSGVPKVLMGIQVGGYQDTKGDPNFWSPVNPNDPETYNVVIENCYVHDVQTMHNNNKNNVIHLFNNSTALGTAPTSASNDKMGGGIIVTGRGHENGAPVLDTNIFGYNGVLVEGNIVKKVGLEGLRNGGSVYGNFVMRGNYIELTFGDGIVMCRNAQSTGDYAAFARPDNKSGLVENNILKDTCAAPNHLDANYAACWSYFGKELTFQYNEAYGTLYGYQDGEAWDADEGCEKVIYQYNYSHHNAGGAYLSMINQQRDCIFRYNISANDGAGTPYMDTIKDGPGAVSIDTSARSYTDFPNGQSIFHDWKTSGGNAVPLIYNNTFYIGDGITTGLYGHRQNAMGYTRFFNNIIIKAGRGTVTLAYRYNTNDQTLINPLTGFKNNLLWAYDTDPAVPAMNKFTNNSGVSIAALCAAPYNNKFQNPKLQIQDSSYWTEELRAQRDDSFTEFTDPEALKTFTSVQRLRRRASMFAPKTGSPVIGTGMAIPAGGGAAVDGAWNDEGVTEDFFGKTIGATPPIGAAVGPYRSAY